MGGFDNDSGLVFEWDVDMWNLAEDGQDARWPDSHDGSATKGEQGGTVIASTEP